LEKIQESRKGVEKILNIKKVQTTSSLLSQSIQTLFKQEHSLSIQKQILLQQKTSKANLIYFSFFLLL